MRSHPVPANLTGAARFPTLPLWYHQGHNTQECDGPLFILMGCVEFFRLRLILGQPTHLPGCSTATSMVPGQQGDRMGASPILSAVVPRGLHQRIIPAAQALKITTWFGVEGSLKITLFHPLPWAGTYLLPNQVAPSSTPAAATLPGEQNGRLLPRPPAGHPPDELLGTWPRALGKGRSCQRRPRGEGPAAWALRGPPALPCPVPAGAAPSTRSLARDSGAVPGPHSHLILVDRLHQLPPGVEVGTLPEAGAPALQEAAGRLRHSPSARAPCSPHAGAPTAPYSRSLQPRAAGTVGYGPARPGSGTSERGGASRLHRPTAEAVPAAPAGAIATEARAPLPPRYLSWRRSRAHGWGPGGVAPLLPSLLPPLPVVPTPQARPQVSPGSHRQHRRWFSSFGRVGAVAGLLASPLLPVLVVFRGPSHGRTVGPGRTGGRCLGGTPYSRRAVVGGGPRTAVGRRASGGVDAIGRDGAVPSTLGWRCLRQRARDAPPGAAGPGRGTAASRSSQGPFRAGPRHRGVSSAAQEGGHGATAAGLTDKPREVRAR